MTQFLIEGDLSKFNGRGYSTATNNHVDYSSSLYNENKGNLTIAEYIELKALDGIKYTIVDENKFDELYQAYLKTLVTQPVQISEADYWYFFECLLPCNWHNVGQYNVFYMSEFLTGNLTSWYVKHGDYHYTFTDSAFLSDSKLLEKLSDAELTTLENIETKFA